MGSKIDPETIKIQAPGAVLEPSGDPWVVLGCLGVLLDDFVDIFGEVGAQDGRKMGQVGSKLRPR